MPLDDVNRDALGRELSRERVTQPVRMHALLDARATRQPLHQRPDVALEDCRALEGAEDRLLAVQPERSTLREPGRQDRSRTRLEPDDAHLVALAVQDLEGPNLEVDVLGPQRERLGQPDAGAVEDRQEGAVPDAGRAGRGAGADEGQNLGGGQYLDR